MSMFERVKTLSKDKNKNLKQVALEMGLGENYFYTLKRQSPKAETLQQIADYFDVSVDYLLGRTDKKRYYDLTEKDEKDIQKELEKLINNLSSSGFAAADGSSPDELDDEDRELLIASLENTLRLSKRLAKKKFTPKKYRN